MTEPTYEGGCSCKAVRYRATRRPIVVHACHCRWCQRETGSAFAINAMYEPENIQVITEKQPEVIEVPTASPGHSQLVWRCPTCKVALWSSYSQDNGRAFRVIHSGTFDEPDLFPPDHHIFTSTKVPWLKLGDDIPQSEEFYEREKFRSKECLERRQKAVDKFLAQQGK